jgi:glycosyltransferase involved in cell wall biosynthesis
MRARGAAAADVAFFPHFDAPLALMPARSVVTIHDLIHFQLPEAFPAWRRAAAGWVLASVVKRAARIITVSACTRSDLVARLQAAAAKTVVIPNGVSESFLTMEPGSTPLEPHRSLRPYLLCVGNRKPHKNHAVVLEALRILRNDPRSANLRLVVVGKRFALRDDLAEGAARMGIEGGLVTMADADDDQLRSLYANCEAFVFPSLYEGFGLPVLEAMACGAPVIASNRSAVPEVAGDAAILVDPTDADAIALAVKTVLTDTRRRDWLVKAGQERVRSFSWARSASRTADVLYSVAAGSNNQGPAVKPDS